MNSMTGFGRGAAHDELGNCVRVEISSVNRKNLDVQVSLPRTFTSLESRCQTRVQQRLHRGRIQIRVEIDPAKSGAGLVFDPARADEVRTALDAYAAARGLAPLTDVSGVLRFPQVFREMEMDTDTDALGSLVDAAMEGALNELCAMRAREGGHLAGVLQEQLTALGGVVDALGPLTPLAREEMTQKLQEAVCALQVDPEFAQPRLLQEIALYAERTDVREELDRIRGHLAQAVGKISAEGPVGRGLDFLCQELAREFNTLSVKAARADINQLALEGKERVEMFREQVQNIE